MLTVGIAGRACDILDMAGYEARVHEGYSGRGMFGKTCVGISTDASGAMVGYAITMAMVEQYGPDVPADEIPRRSDNLGMRMIYY